MTVRKATKIKPAGDTGVDYTNAGAIALAEVSVQAAEDRAGTGAILLEAPDITANFLYDQNREVYDLKSRIIPPENAIIFENGNYIFTPERFSNDGGVTWVEPRVAGGRWILGLEAYTTSLYAPLFEHRPGEGLAYIEDRTTLAVKAIHSHPDMDAILASADVVHCAVFGNGGNSVGDQGFVLFADTTRIYSSGSIHTSSVVSVYESTFAVFKNDIVIGNTNSLPTNSRFSVFRAGLDGVKRYGFSSATAGESNTQLTVQGQIGYEIKGLLPVIDEYHTNRGGVMMLGIENIAYTISHLDSNSIYITSYHLDLNASGTNNDSVALVGETPYSIGVWDSMWHLYTDQNKYVSQVGDFSLIWTPTPYTTTESSVVPLSETFGMFNQKYLTTSNLGGIDWLGHTVADVPVVSTADEKYRADSMPGLMPKTQMMIPVSIPMASPDTPPTIVSGIMLNNQDKLIIVSNQTVNLNITGVEQ